MKGKIGIVLGMKSKIYIKSGGNKTKIKLICLRIDNSELKTTSKEEWIKFIRRHRGNVKSIEQFNWEIPEDKLEKALEYSFDELYEFKLKEGRRKQQ